MSRMLIPLALVSILLTGCLESKTVLTVNPDGSGTLESTAYWQEMQMGPETSSQPKKELDPKELQEKSAQAAKKMGEGVTLKSAKVIKHADGRQGANVVYAFTDINKVKIAPTGNVGPIQPQGDEGISFAFTKSPAPKLVITMPEPKDAGGAKDAPEDPQAQAMQQMMMMQMAKGFLVEFKVKINGTITKTNAAYADKNTLTLVKEDLDSISKDPALMKEFLETQKIKDPKEGMKKVRAGNLKKYIQLETEKVTVDFK